MREKYAGPKNALEANYRTRHCACETKHCCTGVSVHGRTARVAGARSSNNRHPFDQLTFLQYGIASQLTTLVTHMPAVISSPRGHLHVPLVIQTPSADLLGTWLF